MRQRSTYELVLLAVRADPEPMNAATNRQPEDPVAWAPALPL
jgi:hypothetical protein